ncbi:MAG: hypothetical protein CMH59_20495, partial [Myxococcales bacterium]|nr:hypothetical protein [Myxococcales bacterium]
MTQQPHPAPAAPTPSPAPRRHAGEGWLEHRGDVRVLKVKGDFHEMGRQHGALLADDVRRGPIPYYRETVERIVARSFLGKASPLVWPLVQRALG